MTVVVAVAFPEQIDCAAAHEITGRGFTTTLYGAGREVHPAAEPVIENTTDVGLVPEFVKTRRTGLSV